MPQPEAANYFHFFSALHLGSLRRTPWKFLPDYLTLSPALPDLLEMRTQPALLNRTIKYASFPSVIRDTCLARGTSSLYRIVRVKRKDISRLTSDQAENALNAQPYYYPTIQLWGHTDLLDSRLISTFPHNSAPSSLNSSRWLATSHPPCRFPDEPVKYFARPRPSFGDVNLDAWQTANPNGTFTRIKGIHYDVFAIPARLLAGIDKKMHIGLIEAVQESVLGQLRYNQERQPPLVTPQGDRVVMIPELPTTLAQAKTFYRNPERDWSRFNGGVAYNFGDMFPNRPKVSDSRPLATAPQHSALSPHSPGNAWHRLHKSLTHPTADSLAYLRYVRRRKNADNETLPSL